MTNFAICQSYYRCYPKLEQCRCKKSHILRRYYRSTVPEWFKTLFFRRSMASRAKSTMPRRITTIQMRMKVTWAGWNVAMPLEWYDGGTERVCEIIGFSVNWGQLEIDDGRAGMRYKIISPVRCFMVLVCVMDEIRKRGGVGCFSTTWS